MLLKLNLYRKNLILNTLKNSHDVFKSKENKSCKAKLNVNPFPKMPLVKNEILGEIREEIELEDKSRQMLMKKSKSTKIQSMPDKFNSKSNNKWQLGFGVTELEDLDMHLMEQIFHGQSESSRSSANKKVKRFIVN